MATALQDLLTELRDAGSDKNTSVGDVLDSFEQRSLGVLLTVFAGIAVLPVVSALPGIPLLTASLIIVAVFQSLFTSGGIWAPARVRRISISSEKFRKGVEKAMPVARWIDKLVDPRLSFLVEGRVQSVMIAICSALLAVSFLPLSIIPFAVLAPGFAVLFFGLALLGRDGLFALIGYSTILLTILLALWLF